MESCLRFISYMVASELSSVVVLKFRRLYDRPKLHLTDLNVVQEANVSH